MDRPSQALGEFGLANLVNPKIPGGRIAALVALDTQSYLNELPDDRYDILPKPYSTKPKNKAKKK